MLAAQKCRNRRIVRSECARVSESEGECEVRAKGPFELWIGALRDILSEEIERVFERVKDPGVCPRDESAFPKDWLRPGLIVFLEVPVPGH